MATSAPSVPAQATSEPTTRTSRRPKRPWRKYGLFLALITPNFVLILVFGYWPVVYNAILSFHRWDMISPVKRYVGLDNYQVLLSSDLFGRAMQQTFILLIGVTVGSLILGLTVALLLDQRLRGRNFARTISFAPYVVGGAATAMMWLYVFDPNFGLIRPVLEPFGIGAPNWVNDPDWALPGLIIVHIWRHAGFVAVIYIAGLQAIPRELKEAATVDGAGILRRFRHITLPLLTPVTFFVLVTTVVTTFQSFDLIAIMTAGGPGGATQVLSWHIYEAAFERNDAGDAGASATIMFALLLVMTALQARILRRSLSYTS